MLVSVYARLRPHPTSSACATKVSMKTQLAAVPLRVRVEAAQDPCTQGEERNMCVSVVLRWPALSTYICYKQQ